MGNITRFGWSSNQGGGGGGGGDSRVDDYRRFSRSLRTSRSSGYNSGCGIRDATMEEDDEKNAYSTNGESDAAPKPSPATASGGRIPVDGRPLAHRASLERRGGTGGAHSHIRSVSPPSELPAHLPDDAPGAATDGRQSVRGRGMGSGISAGGTPDGEWSCPGGGDGLSASSSFDSRLTRGM